MTDYTERDRVVEAHYRANAKRIRDTLGRKIGNFSDANDITQMAYELALKYYRTLENETHFNKWFLVILKNARSKFMNQRRAAGLTSTMWDHWGAPEPEPLALEAQHQIDSKPDNERHILTLHFIMGYHERTEIPDMVPETEWEVRKIIAEFREEMRAVAKANEK